MQSVMTGVAVVGTGPFAAAHLGELTRIVPPELIDDILTQTKKLQQRVRLLPARTVVYFLLAMTLFADTSYLGVWSHLVAGLHGASLDPSACALRQARRRIGVPPLRMLLHRLCAIPTPPGSPGRDWNSLRVVAWDGTTLAVPDTPANASRLGRHAGSHGPGGYPLARLSVLVECGTRKVIDAVFGPSTDSEQSHATTLMRSLRAGMLLLGDRNYDSHPLLTGVADTGADLLIRAKGQRVLPVVEAATDGSWLSFLPDPRSGSRRIGVWKTTGGTPPQGIPGLQIRVVSAAITTTDPDGHATTSTIRLLTTLLDPQRYPATDLVALYHQRWEIETAFYGLKVTLRGPGRVLRSGTPEGVDQEIYAYLITYQATRIAVCQAAEQAGLDPDRLSFTIALRTARQTVTTAHGITEGPHRRRPARRITTELVKPCNLLPRHRRPRTSPRRVKRPLSAYAYKGRNTDRHKRTVITTVTITAPSTPDLTPPDTA